MKQFLLLIFSALVFGGCSSLDEKPYEQTLCRLEVQIEMPQATASVQGVVMEVVARDQINQNEYRSKTDAQGLAQFLMPQGLYRLSLSERLPSGDRFNGVVEQVRLDESSKQVTMELIPLGRSSIIIKEMYFGGCPQTPLEGRLQNDQYIILHNNDSQTQYLDGLCFGCADPYTSASTQNTWVEKTPEGNLVFQDFVPIVEAVWQFPGSGRDFALQAGEDAVLVIKGAVDFTQEFPLSVNLNQSDYFVCHSRLHYANEKQHITPGDQIRGDHILSVLKKTGTANAFVVAIQSPAVVIFRPDDPQFDLKAYMNDDGRCLATVPGGRSQCVKVPWSWVLDGVEVFYSIKNSKRLAPKIDAGAFLFSGPGLGHSLHRKLDEDMSADLGYEVYCDTNNSEVDFYERPTASLHK